MTLSGVEKWRMPFISDATTSDSGSTMARNATPRRIVLRMASMKTWSFRSRT
jgi:hypothetical protein